MQLTARGQARDFGESTLIDKRLSGVGDGWQDVHFTWQNIRLRRNGHYKLGISFDRDDVRALAPILTPDDLLGEVRRRLTRDQVLGLARDMLTQEDLLAAADLSDSDKLTLARETAEGLSLAETVRGMARLLSKEERLALADLTDGDKLDHACEVLDSMPRSEALQWIAEAIQRLAVEEEDAREDEDVAA